MLKIYETVKEAEIRAVEAARDLLRDVPGLQVETVEYERKIGRDNAVDGLIDFAHGGRSQARQANQAQKNLM